MTKDLFNRTITPRCAYCEHGNWSSDRQRILCLKKGVVSPEFFCRKFVYNPLKRVPKKPLKEKFEAADFSL